MTAISHPLAPLVAMSLMTATALCALVCAGSAQSNGMEAVLGCGWALMLVLWMDADARKLRRLPCHDFGFLTGMYFPLSLVWYCFWSRGWRGGLMLLVLLALWVAPYVIATAFWIVSQIVG